MARASGVRSATTALAIVSFGVFVAADDLLVVSTMLRPIVDDLGLVLPDDIDDAAWIVNVYLIGYVAVMPLAGRLSDVFGRREVFVGSLVVFLVGSVIVPIADGLPLLLAGRALTAIGGGALIPVGMAVVGDVYDEPARARALGLLAGIGTLGWVWGPIYGALLVRFLTWEWQFYLNVPLSLIGIGAGLVLLPPTERTRARIDWTGAILLTAGLVALSIALLDEAQIQSVAGLEELTGDEGGFAGPWLYALAAAALVGFVLVERRVREPLVDLAVVRRPRMASALLVNALLGAGLVIAIVDVPLYVNVVEGDLKRGAVVAGAMLTALTSAMALASVLGGWLTGRFGDRVPMFAGLSVAGAALSHIGLTWGSPPPYGLMVFQLALLGAGAGLVIAPTTAAAVDESPLDRRGIFAGLVIQLRLIGFTLGLAGLTAWGTHRFNQLRDQIELPSLADLESGRTLAEAEAEITTTALAETFLGAAVAIGVALLVALTLNWRIRASAGVGSDATGAKTEQGRPSDAAVRRAGGRHTPQ